MLNKIVELSNQLRGEGLPVSIRSTQSAAEVYNILGEKDRNLLKTALMAIYVKDKYDIPKFEKILHPKSTVCPDLGDGLHMKRLSPNNNSISVIVSNQDFKFKILKKFFKKHIQNYLII